MTAIELADYFDNADGSVPDSDVAQMLRKQDAAIKQLRDSLQFLLVSAQVSADEQAKAALAATEALK